MPDRSIDKYTDNSFWNVIHRLCRYMNMRRSGDEDQASYQRRGLIGPPPNRGTGDQTPPEHVDWRQDWYATGCRRLARVSKGSNSAHDLQNAHNDCLQAVRIYYRKYR